tara:strand:+ start:87 stop:401 length:315 start_codon:yes stop_codon:yes gene_type:complete
MNFKIDENLDTNTLLVHVDLISKRKVHEETKRVVFKDIMDIIEENYIPADNYVLGECLSNIHMKLDNRTKDCSGTWKFSLTPNVVKKKKKVVKKPITKKNSRKK